jgi:hypothetical protein
LPIATRSYRTARLPADWNVLPGRGIFDIEMAVCVDPAANNQWAVGPCIYGTPATAGLTVGPEDYAAPMAVNMALAAGTLPGEGLLQAGTGSFTVVGKGTIARLDDSTAGLSIAADADSGDVLVLGFAGTMASGRAITASTTYQLGSKRIPSPSCTFQPFTGQPAYAPRVNVLFLSCNAAARALAPTVIGAELSSALTWSPGGGGPIPGVILNYDPTFPNFVLTLGFPDQCGYGFPGEYPATYTGAVPVHLSNGVTLTVPLVTPVSICIPFR